MGWLVSIALFITFMTDKGKVDPAVMLFTSGLFAIAGGLGSVAASIRNKSNGAK